MIIELLDLWDEPYIFRGRRGHVILIVGFITTYAISAYHHKHYEFESRSGEVYSIQHYVLKFISALRQVFSWYPGFLHQ